MTDSSPSSSGTRGGSQEDLLPDVAEERHPTESDQAASNPAAPESEHTVASEGPVLSANDAYAGLRPRDLGKALVGQQIDQVRLQAFVGGGGMGAVFRGRDTALERTVAIKVLATHHASGANNAKRFVVEAQSAARLDHPNIARIHHVGEDHGLQYIVFEFIDGPNLRDLVAEHGPQPVETVLRYAIQMADALVHAWKRNVVHRDIKPSNILVTAAGQAKLVDMGLARLDQVDQPDQELTATGATLGTFDYIAPEQARDPRDADSRSDIYSLGCTLFFLLTGKPPFPDGTALQKLLRHQADLPPQIREERPDVPRPLARVLERMLAKKPDARQQSPLQLFRELLAVAQPMGIATSSAAVLANQPMIGSSGEAAVRRHLPWIVGVAGLAIFAAALPAYWPAAPVERNFDALQINQPLSEAPEASPPADKDRAGDFRPLRSSPNSAVPGETPATEPTLLPALSSPATPATDPPESLPADSQVPEFVIPW